MGIKRKNTLGRALVNPWVVGFLIFIVLTIGSLLFLSLVDLGLLQPYLSTLLRYLLVAELLVALMFVVYRIQRFMGIKHEAAVGRAFVTPWVFGFLIFSVFTIGSSLYLSFTDYNLFQAPEWVGADNYTELFQIQVANLESPEQRSADALPRRYDEIMRVEIGDGGFVIGATQEAFWRAVFLTIPYAVLSVPLGLIGSMAIALLLNQKVRGLGFWRVLYYMPAILPAVATALLWRWIFSGTGLLNSFLTPFYALFGIETPHWFTDPHYALPAFLIISLWGVFGANAVILLAGLKGISQELYEAADIDGAGEITKFWRITVPMLSPAIFYNLVVSIIGALKVFEVAAFIETPASVGTFLNWLIYTEAFTLRNMGMASAMAWLMLILIIALTAIVFRSSDSWVFYQSERGEN